MRDASGPDRFVDWLTQFVYLVYRMLAQSQSHAFQQT
jgi:hypothetical protein